MKLKEYIFAGLTILLIWALFLSFSYGKKYERNICQAEKLQEKDTQNQAVIENQKKTNEVQQKQKKIISNLDITDDYVYKWLLWVWK